MQTACPHCDHCLEYTTDPPLFCGYCGQRLDKPKPETTVSYDPNAVTLAPANERMMPAPIPREIGGYWLHRLIGTGGMGAVYEAEDKVSGRRVALKLISPGEGASVGALARFRQEGRLASMLSHPRCVFVLAADEAAGQPYIVMELMTGSTLQDLVKERGPLPAEEALTKILDVIEGLREAHRLGLIHRDIKPSNCFLEPDGRVKIGDFGLAKSLVGDSNLTKSGSFMGTPLFASPEQIRAEKVDQQSDVYSVAATLYYLLTGKAPFQMDDPAATMARIVSDPAPPMRTLRPRLSRALDAVVLRGLERDRKRRWKDVEAFQKALLPFVPGNLTGVGVGKRIIAYYLDQLILAVVPVGAILLFYFTFMWGSPETAGSTTGANLDRRYRFDATPLLEIPISLLYFGILEGLWGCTLAKRILRLRVMDANSVDRPGLLKGLARAGVFLLLTQVGSVSTILFRSADLDIKAGYAQGSLSLIALTGYVLLCSTMRKRTGFRGLHDFASGTRVVQLAKQAKPVARRSHRGEHQIAHPLGISEQVGPYRIQGLVARVRDWTTYAGEDPGLNRKVWVWARPAAEPFLPVSRQEAVRPGRLRWLSSGEVDGLRWDCFLAPSGGCSLLSAVKREGNLAWSELRIVLEEITHELCQASKDGSMPQSLGLDQIWLQPSGSALLLDMPLDSYGAESGRQLEDDEQRAIEFLREFTRFVVPPDAGGKPTPIRLDTPLPLRASATLRRLHREGCRFDTLEQFRSALVEANKGPAQITRYKRGEEAVASGFGAIVLVLLTAAVLAAWGILGKRLTEDITLFPVVVAMLVCAGLSLAWASTVRWSIGLWRMRSALVRPDGRPATMLQRFYHVLLFWSVPFALTVTACYLEYEGMSETWLVPGWFIAIGLTAVGYLGSVLWSPQQAVHDRLANVYVVPKS